MTSLEALEAYCTPFESPVWMGDLTFKPIGEIKKDDIVIGFCDKYGGQSFRTVDKNKLCKTKVLSIKSKYDHILKVKMESGKTIRCTSDHQWMTKRYKSGDGTNNSNNKRGHDHVYDGGWKFGKLQLNCRLLNIIDETYYPDKSLIHLSGWLGGMYDGEGSKEVIYQCKNHNSLVHEKIKWAFDELGFFASETSKGWILTGGRQALLDFINICKPFKREYFEKKILGYTASSGNRYTNDKIISIESDGYEKVYCLETETGSYIVWGYASKNSAHHPESIDELLEWPKRRFDKAFDAWQRRNAVDEIEHRKNLHISALYANTNWDDENNDREKAIEGLENYYETLKDYVWEPNKIDKENKEMQELENSDPFLKAGKRNIYKVAAPVEPGQKEIEESLNE